MSRPAQSVEASLRLHAPAHAPRAAHAVSGLLPRVPRRRLCNVLRLWVAFWSCGLCVMWVDAQQPPAAPAPSAAPSPVDGRLVRELRVVGLDTIDQAYVRNQIRTREGETYTQDQMQRDVSRLLRTGRFIDVQVENEPVEDQLLVTIRLIEKPQVESIEFLGAERFKPKELLDELSFAVGDPLDVFEVRQGQEAILRKYREKGYLFAEVAFNEPMLSNQRRVVYTIVENQRVKVRAIVFEGNINYGDRELLGQMESKTYLPIFRPGDYDAERVGRDAAKLQRYYRDRGFLDAEVGYRTEFTDVARENLTVVIVVNEGVRYTLREIRLRGHTVFDDATLRALMILHEGEFLIDARLQDDVKKIQDHYGAQGYIYASAAPSWVFADEPGQVILTLSIREGQQYHVGWIEVDGNSRTQEKVVRRELRFYPTELYDTTQTSAAEQRLKRTNLFTEATIEPVEPDPATMDPELADANVRDARVTVVENPQTNQFIAGIGASSDSGILGNFVLENTNFDLFDTPRSFEEFVKGRAFRGAGQTMRFQAEPGTELSRFRIDFREPYLFDKPIGFGTSLFLFERGRDGYDERRIGGNVSFDKSFEQGWLKGWVGEISLRQEVIGVRDVDAFAAEDIRDVRGDNYLTSIKLALLNDTTDSRFNPTRGHRFSAAWEQAGAMGGDFFFSKITSSYVRHHTVAIDDEGRHSVVSLHAQGGQILGDAPVFERFYGGGIGSLRGFDFRGISPRDGLRNNRIGGDFLLLGGAEYSFPLYDKIIRGVFFADMGTVEENFGISSWRSAVGGGVRLTLDVFGTIPMEFDLAVPVTKDSEDDTRVFSFFIGLPFL